MHQICFKFCQSFSLRAHTAAELRPFTFLQVLSGEKIEGIISSGAHNILSFWMRFCIHLSTYQVLEVREISRHLLFRWPRTTSKRSFLQVLSGEKIDRTNAFIAHNILSFWMRFCIHLSTYQVLEVREISRQLLFRRKNTGSKRSFLQVLSGGRIEGNISDSERSILRFPMRFCMDLRTYQVLEVREISRQSLFRRRNTTSKRSGIQLAPQLLRDTGRTYLGPEHSYLTARSN